jgi:hypothetical protein
MILCDTGPLVAAFNAADRDHARCTTFLRENWSRLVVPSLAVTEICHLLADPQRRGRTQLAAEFCAAVAADELRVIEATPHDYRRMAELLTTYRRCACRSWTRASSRLPSASTCGRSQPWTGAIFWSWRHATCPKASALRCFQVTNQRRDLAPSRHRSGRYALLEVAPQQLE